MWKGSSLDNHGNYAAEIDTVQWLCLIFTISKDIIPSFITLMYQTCMRNESLMNGDLCAIDLLEKLRRKFKINYTNEVLFCFVKKIFK